MPVSSRTRVASSAVTASLAAFLLIISVLTGGGRGGLGDTLAQLLALMLLLYLCWLGTRDRLCWRAPAWVGWLPALALLLPLIQLLPIPMSWWAGAPARAELAGQLAQAGVLPIQVISLNPTATEQALWSLLPATALFLCTLVLPRKAQLALLAVIVALAIASVFMGMAQLAGGNDSTLRLYTPTNRDQAVGFFANRNHFAGLLAMSLPLAFAGTAWAITERLAGRRMSAFWGIAGCVLIILLILGIALSRSRAGMLLGMVAVLVSLPLVMGLRRQRGTKRILAITLAIAGMLAVQFSLLGIFQRLEADPMSDGRWEYAKVTLDAASDYAPLGSGLGTFQQAYQPYEAKHTPGRYIINHAHDDYLELWLEGGVPALLLLGLGAMAWLWRGRQLLRPGPESGEARSRTLLLSRVAWLSASLALLHSALDFPLRTTASMAVFAVLAAIAFSEPERVRPAPGEEPD
jgi:O-antigen ligase